MFDIDPDKPNIPALARILSGMGLLLLVGSLVSMLLAFSGYAWVNEIYAMAGAGGSFLLALLFLGQAKIIEALAVVSARVKSRFAIDAAAAKVGAVPAAPNTAWAGPAAKASKDRIIHVPDEQARQSGFKVR
ncbi:MAG: hypothetical protein IT566_13835 [Rhodospirillaceae bacterium]|nr:hypothetical protein [Rhodospirillaceae bacterium]